MSQQLISLHLRNNIKVSLINSWLRRQSVTICYTNTSESVFMVKSCLFTELYYDFAFYIKCTDLQIDNAVWFKDSSFFNNGCEPGFGRIIFVNNLRDIQYISSVVTSRAIPIYVHYMCKQIYWNQI